MSDSLSNPPPFMNISQKPGILTILPFSDHHPSPSLRRTLSADMSSSNCFSSSIKKTASSHAFSVYTPDSSSSSSDGDDDDCHGFKDRRVGFWSSVQEHQKIKKKIESRKHGDLGSILFQNYVSDAPKSVDVLPYVHPLVQKSANSLTEHSLQICTESLGSETGSDGFSPYPSSEAGELDGEVTKTEYSETETFEWKPIKFGRKKSPPRSFPPPISSLCSPDGASVCIQSRRENGRLILDAVSVPNQRNFRAERGDGRLILSFVPTPASLNAKEEEDELEELTAGEFEEVIESEIAEEENDLETEESQINMEKTPRLSSSVMNFHRLAMMMKRPNGLINRNPTWPIEKYAPESPAPLSQSLPPRPPSLSAADSLNAYEYYWRSNPTGKSAGIQNSIGHQQNQPIKTVTRKLISSNNEMENEKQQISVVGRNRGDYLVPLSNGCKLPRRSLLLREPCCIAST